MMLLTIMLCAVLCALALGYVLKPAATPRAFLAAAFAAGLFSFALYMVLGRPDIPPAAPAIGKGAEADYRQMMLDEFAMMDRLSKNEKDADALIRLAALRLAQGRGGEETMRLLARAQMLAPKDPRLLKILKMLEK